MDAAASGLTLLMATAVLVRQVASNAGRGDIGAGEAATRRCCPSGESRQRHGAQARDAAAGPSALPLLSVTDLDIRLPVLLTYAIRKARAPIALERV